MRYLVFMSVYVWVPSVVSLSDGLFHVYTGAHVLVAQEAGVGGQGIVGKNRVVVGGAGAGRVLARRGVLLEGCRQVQVLRGDREVGY